MSNKDTKTKKDQPQKRPVLRIVYDADKIKKESPTSERPRSNLANFFDAYAQSIENDIRVILEF